jgi:hypothetical protein
MKHLRAVLPLTLVLFLAACGGGGTTTTPPTEQPPAETPPVVQPPIEQPPEEGAPIINSFSANPSTISAGQSVTLAWDVTNAEIIRLEPDPGQGDLSSLTSVTVNPTTTTTYTLEAVSLNGLDDTASVTVTVEGSSQPPTGDVPYYGEWVWEFNPSELTTDLEGQLSISEAAPAEDVSNGGIGAYQSCPEGGCDPNTNGVAFGYGIIGNFLLEDGSSPLAMTLYNTLTEGYLQMIAIDADNSASGDVLSGNAVFYITAISEAIPGTFTLTKISDTPVLPIDGAF